MQYAKDPNKVEYTILVVECSQSTHRIQTSNRTKPVYLFWYKYKSNIHHALLAKDIIR